MPSPHQDRQTPKVWLLSRRAILAQLVEQRFCKPQVVGSIKDGNTNTYNLDALVIHLICAAECAALAAGFALYRRALTPPEIQRAVTEALAQLQGDQP
jgi:hypothetical protein